VRRFRLASARSFRGSWSATQSGVSSVGPSEHVGGKWHRRIFCCSPGAAPKRLPAIAYRTDLGPDNQFCRVSSRPWRKIPGTGRRSGSKPPLHFGRARRWPWRKRERRRSLRLRRFRRCTGRLNATQPGVLAVSTPYIRGLGAPCKGSISEASQCGNTCSFPLA
jgi:hypothetical protein